MKKRFLSYIFLISILSGCVASAPSNRSKLDIPFPAPLELRPVEWHVLPQPEGSNDKKEPFIALTEDGYKNLSENVREATNFIRLQRIIIEKYKKYYEQ